MNRFLIVLTCCCLCPASLVSASDLFPMLGAYQAMQEEATSTELETIYELRPEFEAVIRGQSPQTYDLGSQQLQPGMSDPYFGGGQPGAYPQGTYPQGAMPQGGVAPGTMYGSPYGATPMQQPGYDPFNMSSGGCCTQMPGGGVMYGLNGPQPARLGWSHRWDFEYVFPRSMPAAVGGEVDDFNVSWAADYVTQGPQGWLWKLTPEVNYHNLDFKGSPGLAAANIADNYYRFAHRFEATSPSQGPASLRLGITPAIATDFHKSLNSNGWNLDADATLYLRSSPQWMWVVGAMYWDRAKDYIVPHAGAVWTPNQFWEVRAVFPNPRVDYFIGTPLGIATWIYLGADYGVESFQADSIIPTRGQLQMEEWRAFTGLRWETPTVSSYLDFGYVFDRDWRLYSSAGVANISPSDAFMIRLGFRY